MRRLDAILHMFLVLSAASFWAVALTMGTLWFSGRIPSEQWLNAGKVLRGELSTVEKSQLAQLEETKKRYEEFQKQPTFRLIEEAALAHKQAREQAVRESMAEQQRLMSWQKSLVDMQQAVSDEAARWEKERDGMSAAINALRGQAMTEADARLIRIYGQMDSSVIADEISVRSRTGDTSEIAKILVALPERKTAEILEEVSDPVLRARLTANMSAFVVPRSTVQSSMGGAQ